MGIQVLARGILVPEGMADVAKPHQIKNELALMITYLGAEKWVMQEIATQQRPIQECSSLDKEGRHNLSNIPNQPSTKTQAGQREASPQIAEHSPDKTGTEASERPAEISPASPVPDSSPTKALGSSPNRELSPADTLDLDSTNIAWKIPSEPETISPSSLLQAAHSAMLERERDKPVAAHKFLLPEVTPEALEGPMLPTTQNQEKGAEVMEASSVLMEQDKPVETDVEPEEGDLTTPVRIKKVDIPLRNIGRKEVNSGSRGKGIIMKGGKGQHPRFEARLDIQEETEGELAGASQQKPTEASKRVYIIPRDEDEDEEEEDRDESGDFRLEIDEAQELSSSEDECVTGKRKKSRRSESSAKKQKVKKPRVSSAKHPKPKKPLTPKEPVEKFEFSVPRYNRPGITFSVPEDGSSLMVGLSACGVRLEFRLTWYEDHELYGTRSANCLICRFCIRPRCGLCTGCNTKPGGVRRSGHDECHWRRCPYRSWGSAAKAETTGGVLNDAVIVRRWLFYVNVFCKRDFDAQTKRLVRRRLQLYNLVLNMTAEAEMEFWHTHHEAFLYPRLNIEGGDKFHTVFKKLEVAQFRIHMAARRTKMELGLNPNKTLIQLQHATNLQYRARWTEEPGLGEIYEAENNNQPEEDPPAVESTDSSAAEPSDRQVSIKIVRKCASVAKKTVISEGQYRVHNWGKSGKANISPEKGGEGSGLNDILTYIPRTIFSLDDSRYINQAAVNKDQFVFKLSEGRQVGLIYLITIRGLYTWNWGKKGPRSNKTRSLGIILSDKRNFPVARRSPAVPRLKKKDASMMVIFQDEEWCVAVRRQLEARISTSSFFVSHTMHKPSKNPVKPIIAKIVLSKFVYKCILFALSCNYVPLLFLAIIP
mgnify:FL=1